MKSAADWDHSTRPERGSATIASIEPRCPEKTHQRLTSPAA